MSAQRAGGLYGGIRFSTATALPTEQSQSSVVVPVAPVAQVVIEANPALKSPVQERNELAAPEPSTKSSAAWSAALAFAPVRRGNKPKAAPARLPPGAVVSSLNAAMIAPASQTAQLLAPPQAEQEPTGWAKKVKAPSMVIDEDVNGFRAIKPGEGKRRKKNKNLNSNQLVWDPLEPYDPFHPNDYHEYRAWKKRNREEKRREDLKRIEDLKRRRDSSHSEYTSESESDDGRRNRKTARYHSPEREDDAPRGLGTSPTQPEDLSSIHMQVSSPAAPLPETGEEAYLRRLAMSQRPAQSTQPPIAPSFAAQTHGGPSFIPAAAPNPSPLAANPPRFAPAAPIFHDADDMHVEAGQSFQPEPATQTTSAPLTQAMIDERKKNAAAIAARLAALSKTLPTPAVAAQNTQNPHSQMDGPLAPRNPAQFAVRMMAKYGHVSGQGLGANADGIVEPIMLERAAPVKVGKKGEATEDGKPKKPMAGGMGIGGAKMGRIVNSQAEEKNRVELAKYGESSRIVLLRNMVAPEDVDDDLQGEIGEECSKHGTVERVFVHMPAKPPVDPIDAVRIFVQFSGPAGAWKAVRDLDGRFFGGKTVRARYFDEGNFAKRLFDVPM